MQISALPYKTPVAQCLNIRHAEITYANKLGSHQLRPSMQYKRKARKRDIKKK